MYDYYFRNFAGETRGQVRKRMLETCQDIVKEDNQNILIVSHVGDCCHFLWNIVSEDKYQDIRKKVLRIVVY